MCWSESHSDRPTTQQLLRCLEDASHKWVPPLEYPIPDDCGGREGLDFTFGDEGSMLAELLVFAASMLCVLLLPLT